MTTYMDMLNYYMGYLSNKIDDDIKFIRLSDKLYEWAKVADERGIY